MRQNKVKERKRRKGHDMPGTVIPAKVAAEATARGIP
jgi:hypothetical protein